MHSWQTGNHNIYQYYFLHISVTVEAHFKYEMLFNIAYVKEGDLVGGDVTL